MYVLNLDGRGSNHITYSTGGQNIGLIVLSQRQKYFASYHNTLCINIWRLGQRAVKWHSIKYTNVQLFHLLKIEIFKLNQLTVIKLYLIKLPIAKLMQDTLYLVITYRKRVSNCLGTSQRSVLNVYPSEGFGFLIIFIWEKASSQRWVDPKNAVKRSAIDRTEAENIF